MKRVLFQTAIVFIGVAALTFLLWFPQVGIAMGVLAALVAITVTAAAAVFERRFSTKGNIFS